MESKDNNVCRGVRDIFGVLAFSEPCLPSVGSQQIKLVATYAAWWAMSPANRCDSLVRISKDHRFLENVVNEPSETIRLVKGQFYGSHVSLEVLLIDSAIRNPFIQHHMCSH